MTKQVISHEIKVQIAKHLQDYVRNVGDGSMNKSANMLKISVATVSNVIHGLEKESKWDNIGANMWRTIQKQVSIGNEGEWRMVETQSYKDIVQIFDDAANYSGTYGLVAFPGTGKTATAIALLNRENFYLVRCADYFNRRAFLQEVFHSIGKQATEGMTVNEMMGLIIAYFRGAERPVIVLDEADKLSDPVLYFFITFYNMLEDSCGLILMATDYLEKRIKKGVASNRKGFPEIWSRLGRKFIEIQPPDVNDQKRIIRANGIEDEQRIQEIVNQSDSDLRRIKRLVFATKREEAVV